MSDKSSFPEKTDSTNPTASQSESRPVDANAAFVRQTSVVEAYRGPVPPPSYLREYGEISPGLPDRIVQMAEKSLDAAIEESRAKSRLELEKARAEIETARIEFKIATRGQIIAFSLIIGALISGVACAAWKLEGAASAAFAVSGCLYYLMWRGKK